MLFVVLAEDHAAAGVDKAEQLRKKITNPLNKKISIDICC